tara:strand:- start:14 stop:481 length:468 start_codon:yes stop_codon:yes gene_type:complete
MNDIPNTWENREHNLQGLADFFNEYEIPFFGFGSSEKTKKIYVKQIAEIHEYVKPCLQTLMDEKNKKKFGGKEISEVLIKKIMKDILSDLVKKDLVTQKKIQKVKDNLIDIYKDPAFQDTERVEFSTYFEKRVESTIILLNTENFDLETGELIDS